MDNPNSKRPSQNRDEQEQWITGRNEPQEWITFVGYVQVVWGEVENWASMSVRREFGRNLDMPKIMLFENLTIREKLNFLKGTGCLTNAEVKKIEKFRSDRNRLSHKLSIEATVIRYSPKERKDILKRANEAYMILFNAFRRRTKELSSKNVPISDKPRSVPKQ